MKRPIDVNFRISITPVVTNEGEEPRKDEIAELKIEGNFSTKSIILIKIDMDRKDVVRLIKDLEKTLW